MALSTKDAKDMKPGKESGMTTHQANKGGHAPGHLREAFGELLETGEMPGPDFFFGEKKTAAWLIDQMCTCTDIMPSTLCDEVGLPQGSTYAQGARDKKEAAEWAAAQHEQEAQEEAETEALVALRCINEDIRSLEDSTSAENQEVRELAADQLRYEAYVKNKAADLLG